MKINLVDVAESAAVLLAGLTGTDSWSLVRMRICGIFGDCEGVEICDAAEIGSRTGKLSTVEQIVLGQLMTRVESTFELRALMTELSVLAPNRNTADSGPVVVGRS
jgi:hypothetical protein